MPIEDFIRELADPPVAAPRPMRAARPAPVMPAMPAMPEEEDEPAEPMEQMGSIGQTIDGVLQAISNTIEQAGPEVIRWAQEVAQMPSEMKALRAQLDRIEALLTPPEVL